MEDEHTGLGGGGGWQGFQTLVYDPKLSAGRGVEFSAAAQAGDEEIGALDDSVPVHYYPEGEEAVSASTSRPLDSSNKGYQLLQRMGWGGKGLGRNEHGMTEPISAGVEAGVRLGLGKQAQDDHYTAPENISRKKLEVEIQAEEAPERKERREAQALKEQQIKEDVTQIKKTFYCQVCRKQYQTAMELEEHLSSYDHHHTKRLAEARAAEMERTRDERARKEQRRQQREQQRLEEQIRRAQAAAGVQQVQQPAPSRPPPPPPPVAHDGEPAAGGWGWSVEPAPPLPPEDDSIAGGWSGGGGWSSQAAPAPPAQQQQAGGWSGQAVRATPQHQAPAPAPPPPLPDDDTPPPPPLPPPPAPAAGPAASGGGGRGMLLSLKAGGPVVAGRGPGRGIAAASGRRPGVLGRGVAAGGRGLAGARKPVAAGNVFGESSSEDEAS